MAAEFRDSLLAPAGSAEGLQLPLAPLVVDPAWSFLPTSPVIGLPGDSPHGGGGDVPPLPAQAPAGLGMLENSFQAATGGQYWSLGPQAAAAASAPPLLVGGGPPPPPLGASPFYAGGAPAAAWHQGMPAAGLPGSSSTAASGLAAGAGMAPLDGLDMSRGAAAKPFAATGPALPIVVGALAAGMQGPSPAAAAEVLVEVVQPSLVVVGAPPQQQQQQQQQQQAPEQAARSRGGGGGRGAAAPRSRSRGGRGGRSGRSRSAAADSDSDYEAESAPSSDGDVADESDEERAAVEARRKERLRAKNRRAQARYRLKQKAMYEQQAAAVEAATADLERQRLANESLRDRAAALEKIASFKDLSLQALQAAADEAAAGTAGSRPSPLVGPPTLRELHSGDSGSGAATAAAPAVSSAASNGVRQPQHAAVEKPQQPPTASSGSTGAGSSEGGGGTGSGGGLRRRPFEQRAEELTALANREQHGGLAAHGAASPMQQLRAEVLSMTADDFLQDWADFGALAAHTLAELDAGRISEHQAAARLGPAVQYRSLLHTAMLHFKPEVYKQLLAHTHFPEEGPEEAAQRWRSVALAMGCTRAQALQLQEQYQAYCARLRQLSDDSAACMRHLTSLAQEQLGPGATHAAGGEGEEGSFLAGRSLRSMMANYLQLFEAAQRLARQPDAALVALLEFHTKTGSIISGMQKARCAALYKPLFPDIVAIVRTCLEQHGLLPPGTDANQAVAPAAAAAGAGEAVHMLA